MRGSSFGCVLVVDADADVHRLLSDAAAGLGLDVRHLAMPERAWELSCQSDPVAVFAAANQRGEDGISFLLQVGSRWPLAKRVLYAREPVPAASPDRAVDIPVLEFPCDRLGLRALLEELARLCRRKVEHPAG